MFHLCTCSIHLLSSSASETIALQTFLKCAPASAPAESCPAHRSMTRRAHPDARIPPPTPPGPDELGVGGSSSEPMPSSSVSGNSKFDISILFSKYFF